MLVAIWADGLVGAFAYLTRASVRNQKVLVVACEEHSYLVPFIEPEDHFFLKTVIPSRNATREYLNIRLFAGDL